MVHLEEMLSGCCQNRRSLLYASQGTICIFHNSHVRILLSSVTLSLEQSANQLYSLYYVAVLGVSLQNCVMTKEERQEREELREERRTMKEFEDYVLKSPGIPMTVPRQTGPMPTGMPGKASFHKTITRSTDVSSADLPLRQHFSSPNPRRSMHQESAETLSGHQAQSQTSFVQTNKANES